MLTLGTINLWLSGCGERVDHEHEDTFAQNATQKGPDGPTRGMIDSVRTACDAVDPMKITFYLTAERARLLKEQYPKAQGADKINLYLRYGFEELKSGNTQAAIEVFSNILAQGQAIPEDQRTPFLYQIKSFLATAYLRLGEQENCILNHTAASCIIPIIEEGQHTKTQGSEQAKLLFGELIDMNPNNLTAKYLYNIAAMTLGDYPESIPEKYKVPSALFSGSEDFPRFREIAMELGLDVRGLAGGVATEDFNNDGLLDIFCTSWGFDDQVHLFLRQQDGSFEDATIAAGLEGVTGGLNTQHADYNNDGYFDILILRGAWFGGEGRLPNSLLRNNGDGTFTDVAVEAGIYSKRPTQTAAWADFDLDGWLDLFVGNESNEQASFLCEIYRNKGDGTFEDVTNAAGFERFTAFVKGVTAGDIDNDGYPDLYLSLLGSENRLLRNRSKAGRILFEDISANAGIGEPIVSFPTWMFDVNNDGFLDIFVSSYTDGHEPLPGQILRAYGNSRAVARPRLYINNGNLTFTEVSSNARLTEPVFTMGSNFGDLDNDGYLDMYLGTGEPDLMSVVPNKMYLNAGGRRFIDVTYPGGFGNIQKGHGIGFADFDRDGDQDIYAVMGGSLDGDIYQNILFENSIGNKNNWVVIRLEGVKANRKALGARIYLEVQEDGEKRNIHRMVSGGSSFGGNSFQEEIGLGKADIISELKVYWPTQETQVQSFKDLEVNRFYLLKEGGNIQKVEYKQIPFVKRPGEHHDHTM